MNAISKLNAELNLNHEDFDRGVARLQSDIVELAALVRPILVPREQTQQEQAAAIRDLFATSGMLIDVRPKG